VTTKEGAKVEEMKTTPTLKGSTYPTGRGGVGNMARLDPERPEEARQAQDVDVPPILLPEGQNRTGRGKSRLVQTLHGSWLTLFIKGGIANIYTPSNQEIEKARLHNERIRRESFNKKDASLKQKIVNKAKEKLPISNRSPSRELGELSE
jgi:hypothetical protein